MRHPFLFIAAVTAMLAVCLGAFGAHGLKHVLSADMLNVYKTAVTYQMWHALGLTGISILLKFDHAKLLLYAAWTMCAGIVLFSGSLYLLVLLNLKWLGMITPLGGLCFIIGWALLSLYAFKQYQHDLTL